MIDLRIKNNPWIFTPTYEKIYKKKEINDYTINYNHSHKYHFYRTLNEYLREIKESLIENDFIKDNDSIKDNNNSIDKFKIFLNENSISIDNYTDENIKEIFVNNEKSNYDDNANKQIYSHLTLGTIINLSC